MGVLREKASLVAVAELSDLENYAASHKTRLVSIHVWTFERLPIGQVCLRWRNGSIATFTDRVRKLREWLAGLDHCPKPLEFSRPLPHDAGRLYMGDFEEPTTEEAHHVRRIRRQREVVIRQTRTRTSV